MGVVGGWGVDAWTPPLPGNLTYDLLLTLLEVKYLCNFRNHSAVLSSTLHMLGK